MKKIKKFCNEWNIGKKEVLQFIMMLLAITIGYIVLILSAILCS